MLKLVVLMKDFSLHLNEAVRDVLTSLRGDAPTPEVVKAHCRLSGIVRQHAEDLTSYGELLVAVGFPNNAPQATFVDESDRFAKLIVVHRWGAAFRHRNDEALDRLLETALSELVWGMQLGSPDSRLTHTVAVLLDEHRRENAQRWPTTNAETAAVWAEALSAAETFRLPSTDGDLQLSWGDVGTELVNWRFSERADSNYWGMRNRLLLNALGTFQDDFIHDHSHSLLDGLPTHFASEEDYVKPPEFFRRGGRISGWLEIPIRSPREEDFPVDMPNSEFERHRYRVQLIRWIDEFFSRATASEHQPSGRGFEIRSTSLAQLHNLGLPVDSPRAQNAVSESNDDAAWWRRALDEGRRMQSTQHTPSHENSEGDK